MLLGRLLKVTKSKYNVLLKWMTFWITHWVGNYHPKLSQIFEIQERCIQWVFISQSLCGQNNILPLSCLWISGKSHLVHKLESFLSSPELPIQVSAIKWLSRRALATQTGDCWVKSYFYCWNFLLSFRKNIWAPTLPTSSRSRKSRFDSSQVSADSNATN